MGCGASVASQTSDVAPGKVVPIGGITGCLVADGKTLRIPDYTITHSHDPFVASVQSWFKAELVKNNAIGSKLTQNDLDVSVKDFFKDVKQYNVDTAFSAINSLESHADALMKRWEAWKSDHTDAADKIVKVAEYAQIIVYAGIAKLIGNSQNQEIAEQMVKYTAVDPGWATTVFARLAHPEKIAYRPAPSLDAYVYPMKSLSGSGSSVRIALISDWGTGSPQAYDLLSKVAAFKPDMTLHLGDVYYSGTQQEQEEFVYAPVKKHLSGTQFYNLPGNHDYYSGGEGYLKVIDDFNVGGFSQQQSSFFALEGDSWVIITMDTALHDSNPLETVVGAAMTWLEEAEAEWVRDKVSKAKAKGKKIIFMSHHQWCTLCSTVGRNGEKDQALNHNLYRQLKDVIGDVDAWYWGHEHSLQFFEPYAGLKRGRLIGNGSVPCLLSANPYKPKDLEVPTALGCTTLPVPLAGTPQMSVADFGYYYNNSFVILTLEGSSCKADYYDIPWISADIDAGCKWGEPKLVYSETY